jgi:hypothetical protein
MNVPRNILFATEPLGCQLLALIYTIFLYKKTPCYFYIAFYVSVKNPKHTMSLSLGNNFVSLRVLFSVFTENVSSFRQCFLRND